MLLREGLRVALSRQSHDGACEAGSDIEVGVHEAGQKGLAEGGPQERAGQTVQPLVLLLPLPVKLFAMLPLIHLQ